MDLVDNSAIAFVDTMMHIYYEEHNREHNREHKTSVLLFLVFCHKEFGAQTQGTVIQLQTPLVPLLSCLYLQGCGVWTLGIMVQRLPLFLRHGRSARACWQSRASPHSLRPSSLTPI